MRLTLSYGSDPIQTFLITIGHQIERILWHSSGRLIGGGFTIAYLKWKTLKKEKAKSVFYKLIAKKSSLKATLKKMAITGLLLLLLLTSGAKGSPPSPLTVAVSTSLTPLTGMRPRSRRRCKQKKNKTMKNYEIAFCKNNKNTINDKCWYLNMNFWHVIKAHKKCNFLWVIAVCKYA